MPSPAERVDDPKTVWAGMRDRLLKMPQGDEKAAYAREIIEFERLHFPRD